jgi:hypothetical protein
MSKSLKDLNIFVTIATLALGVGIGYFLSNNIKNSKSIEPIAGIKRDSTHKNAFYLGVTVNFRTLED